MVNVEFGGNTCLTYGHEYCMWNAAGEKHLSPQLSFHDSKCHLFQGPLILCMGQMKKTRKLNELGWGKTASVTCVASIFCLKAVLQNREIVLERSWDISRVAWEKFEMAPSVSVNLISVIFCAGRQKKEEPQTAYPMSFTWASHSC